MAAKIDVVHLARELVHPVAARLLCLQRRPGISGRILIVIVAWIALSIRKRRRRLERQKRYLLCPASL